MRAWLTRRQIRLIHYSAKRDRASEEVSAEMAVQHGRQ
jgi:hypothetical protein